MKFSKEPILWIGFLLILFQVIHAVMSGQEIPATLIDSLVIAAGAVIGRQVTTPVAKDKENDA